MIVLGPRRRVKVIARLLSVQDPRERRAPHVDTAPPPTTTLSERPFEDTSPESTVYVLGRGNGRRTDLVPTLPTTTLSTGLSHSFPSVGFLSPRLVSFLGPGNDCVLRPSWDPETTVWSGSDEFKSKKKLHSFIYVGRDQIR